MEKVEEMKIDIDYILVTVAMQQFNLKEKDFTGHHYSHDEALEEWYNYLDDIDTSKTDENGEVISFEEYKKLFTIFTSIAKSNSESLYELGYEGREIYVWVDSNGDWSFIDMELGKK